MVEWLLAPVDGTRPHEVGALISWHARLMVLAWAFLFPVGVLAARFFKIMPRQNWPEEVDNRAWWRTHLVVQYTGGVAVLVAVVLIWQHTRPGDWHLHRVFGWISVVLCAVQFLLGWFRGSKGGPTDPAPDGSMSGDHYDMTPRRNMFEYIHKTTGYLALLTACFAIMSGLWFSNALRWMWIVIPGWWVLLAAVFVVLQRGGWAVDTYQAIWGPDPRHPGNRIKPIGWGISRRG